MTVSGSEPDGSDELDQLRGDLAAARQKINDLQAALKASDTTSTAVGS